MPKRKPAPPAKPKPGRAVMLASHPCLHCAIVDEINRRHAAGTLCARRMLEGLAKVAAEAIENAPEDLREDCARVFIDALQRKRAAFRERDGAAVH